MNVTTESKFVVYLIPQAASRQCAALRRYLLPFHPCKPQDKALRMDWYRETGHCTDFRIKIRTIAKHVLFRFVDYE